MSTTAVLLAQEKEDKAASKKELENVKAEQKKIARRVGWVEQQVKVIKRRIDK